MSVAHEGSTWLNRNILRVGGGGSGTLNVLDGSVVRSKEAYVGIGIESQGIVNVSRAGKWMQETDLRIGGLHSSIGGRPSGSGALHITDGGRVETGRDASLGRPGTAMVTVEGGGSRWEVGGELEINPPVIVNVADGGFITSGTAINNGTVNVSGLNSTWNAADFLGVGGNATIDSMEEAVLNVNAGGRVISPLAFVGAGRIGRVHIDGTGSRWTGNEQMFIGLARDGQVVGTGGAHVGSGLVQIGIGVGSTGLVSVSGAGTTWSSSEGLYVGGAGTGELRVTRGAVLTLGDGAPLSIGLRGKVQGNSRIIGDVTNGGVVAPGIEPSFVPNDNFGTLHLEDGDYTHLPSGTLEIGITSPVLFDRLDIDGAAHLGGTLEVSLVNYMPAVGSSFEILHADDDLFGSFDTELLPFLTPEIGWNIVYTDHAVLLQVVSLP